MKVKVVFSIIISLVIPYNLVAQKTEISVLAGTGLFSFRGSSAEKNTYLNASGFNAYTNSPYGRNCGTSYGFGFQLQRIAKSDFILGFQAGYESLSSKVIVSSVFSNAVNVDATGKTILRNEFINIHPFVGQRFEFFKNVKTDFVFGFDFGIGLSSKEHGEATTGLGNYTTDKERHEPSLDFRPRCGISNYYKHFGGFVGYSYGLTNYLSGYDGGTPEAKAKYLRLGIIYLIK